MKGIALRHGDTVVACLVLKEDSPAIMTISALGFGKRTNVDPVSYTHLPAPLSLLRLLRSGRGKGRDRGWFHPSCIFDKQVLGWRNDAGNGLF